MSNGNDELRPLLRLIRGMLADHRSESNAKIDAISQALDDYERRDIKVIKVDTTVPPKTAEPAMPAVDPGAVPAVSTPADPVNSGKPERV